MTGTPPMRIGIVVIGSLLWEESPVRVHWRADHLELPRKIRVRLPIRYGRSSRKWGSCFTMVFDRLSSESWGTAWVVPARAEADGVEGIVAEATALATAEGMKTTCDDWATIGIWVKPQALSPAQLGHLRDRLDAGRRDRFDALRRVCPLAETGEMDLDWPAFEDASARHRFECLLCAVTRPVERVPSAEEIAACMKGDLTGQGREYFDKNRSAEITTYQDGAILAALGAGLHH